MQPRRSEVVTIAAFGVLAAWFVLASAVQLDAKEEAPGPTVESTHYIVRLDFDDKAMAKKVSAVAESAWKHTQAFTQMSDAILDPKLDVFVYEAVAGYQAAEKKLTKGRFAKSLFFTHHNTKACHCTLVPGGDRTLQSALGVSEHFLRQCAHEASHAAVYVLFSNYRSHPDWMAEGIATHIAERVSRERRWSADGLNSPFYGMRMINCQTLRRRGLLPEPRAIFQEELDHLSTNHRYSVWWSFFRFLVEKHPKALRKILKGARGLGGGTGYTMRLYDIVRKQFDDEALDALNRSYRDYVDAFEPVWSEPHRTLEVRGKRWTQMAYPKSNAIAWQRAQLPSSCAIKGRVTIPPSGNPQANVLVGGVEVGFYSIAFRVGSGVTVFERLIARNKWNRAKHEKFAFAANKPIDFDIEIDGDKIHIGVNGKQRFGLTATRTLEGRFGVGVQARGGATWENVTIRTK